MSAYEEAVSGVGEFKGGGPADRAVASLLDTVQELAFGLAAGQTPEQDWADLVQSVFDQHRAELGVTHYGEPRP